MLKSWVVKVLLSIMSSWCVFVGLTIDSLGDKVYNIVLVIWTALALISVYLLNKYSNIFKD